MARLLVNKGASLDHVDNSGRTVLHDLGGYKYTLRRESKFMVFPTEHQANRKWEHEIALPFVK